MLCLPSRWPGRILDFRDNLNSGRAGSILHPEFGETVLHCDYNAGRAGSILHPVVPVSSSSTQVSSIALPKTTLAKMAGVDQFLSVAPTALRAPLAKAFAAYGIDTAADVCHIMSKESDASKVCMELLGDDYSVDFDDALIAVWEASKVAGRICIRKMAENLPSNIPTSSSLTSSAVVQPCSRNVVSNSASSLRSKTTIAVL